MFSVRVAPGAAFSVISPAGFRILAAVQQAAQECYHDLTITSACDGDHSGPDDPHHLGSAYDIRSHDLPDKLTALYRIMLDLSAMPFDDTRQSAITTELFFGWLEDAGTPNEHLHVQLRHGKQYPS